ncbi:MAG: hypothetical protein LUG18_06690 [Candidatus Azobacteroides sp.]|nr:hypothetical protein [Candidatus Azobacteroides sp.]
MNISCKILIFLFCIGIVGCTDKRSNILDYQTLGIRTLCLPVAFEPESEENEKKFACPKENGDSLFFNTELFPENIRIARLPQRDSIRTILAYSETPAGQKLVKVYTINEKNVVKDSMTLFYHKELDYNHLILQQTFQITENYRFKVSKHLNDILIEQLFYRIDEDGYF